MAETVNIVAYSDALVVLGTAGIVVPIIRRWGVNPIIGYLAAGAMLGPLGLGSLTNWLPFLFWVTVTDTKNVAGIAELGVVFLLFLIGLELSFKRLATMRRLVFGVGGLQFILTTAVIAGIATAANQKPAVALILGASLSLSSTATVLELLSHQGRLTTNAGRASFAVLLAQDLAVIPILLFISVLEVGTGRSLLSSLGSALVQAAIAIAVIIVVGRWLLRPLLQLVASTHSSELFIAAVLFVIIGAGLVTHQAGLSMALGAFVAGLMLAETEYGKAVESTTEPFKGLLLGIFFFTVGMNIDFREFVREPLWLIAAVLGIIGVKSLILLLLGKLFRLSWASALETALLLGPGGEFAFVVVGLAVTAGLVERGIGSFALAATSVTMALTPLLALAARKARNALTAKSSLDPGLAARPPSEDKHAIVVGYGRVGKVVCSVLAQHKIRYIAIDSDAIEVAYDRRNDHNVYYGNATNIDFLKTCGLMRAAAVVISIHSRDAIDHVVEQVRAIRPDILIVSRARDAEHARHLYQIGATDAVPETVEASLQLSEASLVGLGIARGPAIASIHEKRDEFRRALQKAANAAGREEPHSIKPKSA